MGISLTLTVKQCDLLIHIFNASIESATKSGIPIGKEYYEDLDIIKKQLYQELSEGIRREIIIDSYS